MQMRIDEIEAHHPDRLTPAVSQECAPRYWEVATRGREIASGLDVTFLGLVRNSMPWIQFNAQRLAKLGQHFATWRAFIYENDSDDGTDVFLRQWSQDDNRVTALCEKHDRPQLSSEKSKRRTDALAEYRQRCLEWAKERAPANIDRHRVIVIDFDAWGGWSDSGVLNGIGHLDGLPMVAGLASLSTVELPLPDLPTGKLQIHYDSWAFRLNHWEEHDMGWFPHWYPPVGSDPVPCNSAFGGMAIYRPEHFFGATYSGGDCEHVLAHRSIFEATGARMALNPSQRLCMNWIPAGVTDGGQHDQH